MPIIFIAIGVLIIINFILYYKFRRPLKSETNVEGFFGKIAGAFKKAGKAIGDALGGPLIKIIDGFKKIGSVITGFFSRFKNIGRALQYGGEGTGQAIATSGIITSLMFRDTFEYAYEAATYGYRWLTCSIDKLKNLHYCIVFYIFDIILYFIYIIVLSTAVLLDAIFNIKRLLGYSLQSGFNQAVKSIKDLDKLIYSYSGIHIIRYPTYIEDLCYKCKIPPDAKKLERRQHKVVDNFNRKFPKMTRPFVQKFEKSGEEFKRAFRPL